MTPEGAVEVTPADGHPLAPFPDWMASASQDPALVCYLDAVEGGDPVQNGWQARAGASIHIAGWAVESGARVQRDASIRLRSMEAGGKDFYFSAARSERADVTAAPQFAQTPPANAGLTATLRLDGVVPGRYEIVFVIGDEHRPLGCGLGPARSLVVH